ncbi:MAG: DEAD/DEAH box helicase family protein [Hahellaceae bacterium]|nr:DEAD/DEAH box helicase family protein [Hahellaceae bacterium]MCP5210023.1 DEAD/DEAH box helicase family protein [Hahellaceae bacterium]
MDAQRETLLKVGQWAWSPNHQQAVKVIEAMALWGSGYYRVWCSQSDTVIKLAADQLQPLQSQAAINSAYIAYVAAAARVAASQQEDVLLAPIGSTVIPLPHQLKALNKAISKNQVRYLLADEVGLGKTIEAGLVMRELKLRGLVRRILVVAPKGLVSQWVAEMQTHFNEHFELLMPGEFTGGDSNPWQQVDQAVCSMDSIKPIEKRRGWDVARVAEYNQQRFDNVIAAGWDLIVVDESHRLQGSTEQVARFKLGQGLADAAPYFLLLSATPHQGKSDGFHRLMSLLDRDAFPDEQSVTQERVKPYVIRTEKCQAIDANGDPLFVPRKTELVSVAWQTSHAIQRDLYEAVTDYVREGYNQALQAKQNAIGFLMILMQRLVVSSPAAIRATLLRRLEVLNKPSLATQVSLLSDDDWEELDGQQQTDSLLNSRVKALKNEKQEVQVLLDLAERCVQQGIDAKADALLDWVTRLQREEDDPNLKVLVFTEFVPTQLMLAAYLSSRGMSVVTLNGSLSMEERKHVQDQFAGDTRILISTDAGGEGLNLQFCHVIINYDIPWNPMRLEQRIGRVDRIGQKHMVRALNFVFEDTVEHRVREVLEEKLNTILEEFGVDKTGDVLDSSQAGHLFDELYTGALQNPDQVDAEIEKALAELRGQATQAQASKLLIVDETPLDAGEAEALSQYPLPYWVERMTVNYLRSEGEGSDQSTLAEELKEGIWQLRWPDQQQWSNCVFTSQAAIDNPTTRHISLDEPRVRGIAQQIPAWAEGQPVPRVTIPSIPASVQGTWSLWRIRLINDAESDTQQQLASAFLPVFFTEEGKSFPTTANRIWEALLSQDAELHPVSVDEEPTLTEQLFSQARTVAETVGEQTFQQLQAGHAKQLKVEDDKFHYALNARKRAVDRIGLPEVRDYRHRQLEEEAKHWQAQLNQRQQSLPELVPLLLLKVGEA